MAEAVGLWVIVYFCVTSTNVPVFHFIQMYKSIFITIPKVKGTAKCKKHRSISSLKSHVTKLVLRVIMNRIRGRTLSEISEVQAGFMPERGQGTQSLC